MKEKNWIVYTTENVLKKLLFVLSTCFKNPKMAPYGKIEKHWNVHMSKIKLNLTNWEKQIMMTLIPLCWNGSHFKSLGRIR